MTNRSIYVSIFRINILYVASSITVRGPAATSILRGSRTYPAPTLRIKETCGLQAPPRQSEIKLPLSWRKGKAGGGGDRTSRPHSNVQYPDPLPTTRQRPLSRPARETIDHNRLHAREGSLIPFFHVTSRVSRRPERNKGGSAEAYLSR